MANLSVPMAVMELANLARIQVEAYDASGALVTGVKVSKVAISAIDLSPSDGSGGGPAPGPLLVPSSV